MLGPDKNFFGGFEGRDAAVKRVRKAGPAVRSSIYTTLLITACSLFPPLVRGWSKVLEHLKKIE